MYLVYGRESSILSLFLHHSVVKSELQKVENPLGYKAIPLAGTSILLTI